MLTLAQKSEVDVWLWSGVLVAVVVLGFLAVALLRKQVFSDDSTETSAALTLGDLRRLHAQGKMSTEEFEAAKLAIIGTVHRDRIASAPPAPAATEQKPE